MPRGACGSPLRWPRSTRREHLVPAAAGAARDDGGNLSTHLRKLEDAGYVEVAKTFRGRTPVTYLALTKAGRRAFEDYTDTLRTFLGGQP